MLTSATRLKRENDENQMYFVASILGSRVSFAAVIQAMVPITTTTLPQGHKVAKDTRHGPITVIALSKLGGINFTKAATRRSIETLYYY